MTAYSTGMLFVLAAATLVACGVDKPTPGALSTGSGAGGATSAASTSAGTTGGGGATTSNGTTTRGGTTSSTGTGDPPTDLVWHKASLTNFESYPDPGSEECVKYNGCAYVGEFAFVDGKQTESWVEAHNIAAVHSKDANTYKLKTLRLEKNGQQIDVTVYDECADSDCSGCCTENAKPSGFLIDLEKYTAARFGGADGQVDWACLDCN